MAAEDITSRIRDEKISDKIVVNISTALFLLTVIFITIQIFVRTILNTLGPFSITIVWTQPAAQMALILGAFWGAAVASRNREHITITFPIEKLREYSTRGYLMCRILVGISSVSYAIVIFYGMFQKTRLQWSTNFPGLGFIPGGAIFLSITIALLLLTLYEGLAVVEEFRNKNQSNLRGE